MADRRFKTWKKSVKCFCQMRFNEGKPLHYGFVAYTAGGADKKSTVQWQMRTEEASDNSFGTQRGFSWRVMLSVAALSQSDEAWNHRRERKRGITAAGEEGLVFHRRLKFRSVSSEFIFREGNKYWIVKCHWFAISVSLTSPEKLTWGIRHMNWTRI